MQYRPRSRSEGFDPDRAKGVPLDFAVTAFSNKDGESAPALASTDCRFWAPENEKMAWFIDQPHNGTTQLEIAGLDFFPDSAGLHVRIAIADSEVENLRANFPPGTMVRIFNTRGTEGLEQFFFQVRSIQSATPGSTDTRVTYFGAVGGIPGRGTEGNAHTGPWLTLEAIPSSDQVQNLYAKVTGTDPDIVGPGNIGLNIADSEFKKDNPLNLGEEQCNG